jgi:hypothetical protein
MKRFAVAVAVLLLVGCSDSTSPDEPRTAGLVIWASGSTSDTVYAGPITVRARLLDDRLQPVVGAMINFSALLPPNGYLGAFAGPSAAIPTGATFSASTDSRGEAAVRLWHGWLAGSGTLKADAIEPSNPSTIVSSASLPLVTLPGHAVSVLVSPRDTALFKGNSATIIGQVLDRFDNVRDERAVVTALTPGLDVSGSMVRATADPSRQRVQAVWQGLADTGYVSIVPQGAITARVIGRPGPAYDYAFASFRLDGSDFTPFLSRLAPPHYGSCCADLGPQWEPGDTTLIFFDGSGDTRLFRTTRGGAVSPVLLSSAAADDVWPQVTADGQWVYFARTTRASNQSYIFRSRPDGSQLEQVTATVGPYTNDLYPSPSPDGRYVVYATDRETYGSISNLHLQVVDTQTGAVRSLGVAGTIPRWSPNGDLIVFGRADALWLVAPDGTGLRQLSPSGRGYKAWASWSPDGKWIAAEHFGPNIDIIEAATGMTLPLGFTGYLTVPTWQLH